MGQLDQFADNVTEIMADLEDQAGALNVRASKLKMRGAEVLGRWNAHFNDKERSLKSAEDAINRLSNVPLSGPSTSERAPEGGAISTIPVKAVV